jgi:hypothetical protein
MLLAWLLVVLVTLGLPQNPTVLARKILTPLLLGTVCGLTLEAMPQFTPVRGSDWFHAQYRRSYSRRC